VAGNDVAGLKWDSRPRAPKWTADVPFPDGAEKYAENERAQKPSCVLVLRVRTFVIHVRRDFLGSSRFPDTLLIREPAPLVIFQVFGKDAQQRETLSDVRVGSAASNV